MILSDIATIYDCPHSTAPDEGEGYALIRTPNVGKGRLILDDVHRVSKEVYDLRNKRAVPQEDDIIFAREAPAGNAAIITKGQKVCLGQRTVLIKPNRSLVNAHYLVYYLLAPQQQIRLLGYSHGATVGHVNIPDIANLPIALPSILVQTRIASIIESYENLIEVNNKRIKVLEQMAENLYKEWFVRFRFPGHETAEFYESRIGKLPSSFRVVKNKDVFEYYIGGGWGNDDEDTDFPVPAYVIRGTDFPRVKRGDISTCPLRYHKVSNYSARELRANDIIIEVSGGTSEQPVGRALLVTQDVIDRLDGRVICASFCKQVRVNKAVITPLYYNYWMKFLYDTRIIDRFQLQSTGIINFQFEFFLNKGDVMLPPLDLMEQFDSTVMFIMDQISTIAKENENLIKQRDLLLPRLMSGKLEV